MTDDSPQLDLATFLVSSIHDMKNSVNVMASYLESALRQAPPDDHPARAETAKALYEAQRISDNLLQLLSLYKIDQNFYPFDPQEHDLEDFGRDILGRVAPLAEGRGVALDLDCPEGLRWWFDYELVYGAVLQALHNALVYTRSRIRLSFQRLGALLELRVWDDGPGYPPHLLEQGHALGQGICHESGSTGLGLYFSGVVARMHRNREALGHTRLENDPQRGGGSFVLCLP